MNTQAALLSSAVQDTADAAAATQEGWTEIVKGFRDFSTEVSDGGDRKSINAALNVAVMQGWSRLAHRVAPLEKTFAGMANAIPPGQALA